MPRCTTCLSVLHCRCFARCVRNCAVDLLLCFVEVKIILFAVKVAVMPLARDKWLLDVTRERLFVLLRQHIERGNTGELLEQVLLCIAAIPHKGVAPKVVEAVTFILRRCVVPVMLAIATHK